MTGRSTPVRCSPEYCGEPLPHAESTPSQPAPTPHTPRSLTISAVRLAVLNGPEVVRRVVLRFRSARVPHELLTGASTALVELEAFKRRENGSSRQKNEVSKRLISCSLKADRK